ncbi:MAG: hypothetical protein ACOY5Y_07730 [Pseudomonadota bacterium]
MKDDANNEWSERAASRLWTATTEDERNRAVVALFNLYRQGDRRSGYELAIISPSWLPSEVVFTRDERVRLIVERAFAGDDSAALELVHAYRNDVDPEQLHRALAMAASAGNLEAQELLQGW